MQALDVKVSVFEVGEFVRTAAGVAKIVSERKIFSETGFWSGQIIFVQHKFPWSQNPANEVVDMPMEFALPSTEAEYDAEKDI